MCLVKIAKNSFYRVNEVPSGAAVATAPRFKDMSVSGNTTVKLEGGMNPQQLVVSGTVPSNPLFGGGVLSGAYFRTFVSGLSLSGSSQLPVVDMFKIEDGIGPTQGTSQFSTRQDVGALHSGTSGLGYGSTGAPQVWTDATCDTTAGSTTVTMDDTTPTPGSAEIVSIGQTVSGSGIPSGATVTSIDSATAFSISAAATASASNVTLSFGNVIRGDKIFVMSSYMDGSTNWLEENFDGADKSLGEFQMLGDQGTATLSLEDAFLPLHFATKLVYQGGGYFLGAETESVIEKNIREFFSDPGDENTIYIAPVNRSRVHGLWTTVNDRRTGKNKWYVYRPYYNFKDIRGYIDYKTKRPATDDVDASKIATENNTIFSSIAVQSTHGNIYSADEDQPLVTSALELSTDKKVSGGQSLRFYHLWEYVPSWAIVKKIEATLGNRQVNPQVTRACIYNIPEPPPAMDMGAYNYLFNQSDGSYDAGSSQSQYPFTGTGEKPGLMDGAHLTDKRLTFPEINITMNIAKLYPSPQIEVSSSQARDTWGDTGYIYAKAPIDGAGGQSGENSGDRLCWTVTDQTNTAGYGNGVWEKSKGGLTTLLRSVAITFSNYKPDAYPTLDEFLAASLDDVYWHAGTGTAGQLNADTDYEWAHDTTKAKMASGIIFQTFIGASEYNLGITGASGEGDDRDQDINIDYIYCAALPMARYNRPSGSDTGLYASGGFAKFDNCGLTYSGTSTNSGGGMTLVWDPRIGLEELTAEERLPAYSATATRQGRPWGDSGSRFEPLWVAIPKDSWFNLKFVFDSQANAASMLGPDSGDGGSQTRTVDAMVDASGGTYQYTVGDAAEKGDDDTDHIGCYGLQDPSCQFGVPLRVYISGAINAAADREDTATNVPYLNIPLPTRRSFAVSVDSGSNWFRNNTAATGSGPINISEQLGGIQTGYETVRGGEGLNPYKYMTVWVNNYRYTEYTATGSSPLDNADYCFWRGNYQNGGDAGDPQAATTAPSADYPFSNKACYRAADSKLHPKGLSAETEVFIDNITFKYWNNEHVNHSIESGELSRFIRMDTPEALSPVSTYYSTGTIFDDDRAAEAAGGVWDTTIASGGSNKMTAMMKGFSSSGAFRTVNPGRFLSFGFDSPEDFPLRFNRKIDTTRTSFGDGVTGVVGVTAETIASGYFLFNTFTAGGDFGDLEQVSPDVCLLSTAQPMKALASGATTITDTVGTVNYGTGFSSNAGASVAGRNFSLYNPCVSGGNAADPTAMPMRTKQSQNIPYNTADSPDVGETVRFDQSPDSAGYYDNLRHGWVIDNHGDWFSKPSSDWPSMYSNVAAWAGQQTSAGSAATANKAFANNGAIATSGALYTGVKDDISDPIKPSGSGDDSLNLFYGGFSANCVTGSSTADTDGTTGNVSGSGGAINMGIGNTVNWLSTDGFTQKGYVKMDIDVTDNRGGVNVFGTNNSGASWATWARWAPRENILCSAKITGVPGSVGLNQSEMIEGNSLITVDDTSIFNVDGNDRYVIFEIGSSTPYYETLPNNADFSPNLMNADRLVGVINSGNSSTALGYHSEVKLSNIKNPVQGNTVSLMVSGGALSEGRRHDGIIRADDGVTRLCTEQNEGKLWISPLKYWVTLGFFDAEHIFAGSGSLSVARSYESVCSINSTPADGTDTGVPVGSGGSANFDGSTFNESNYFYDSDSKALKGESALYVNSWILSPAEPGETNLDLQDYGYGEWDNEGNTGGEAGIKAVLRDRLNYVDISGIVTTTERPTDSASQPVVLVLGLSDQVAPKMVEIYSDEYSDATVTNIYKPAFIWEYYDSLPHIEEFSVKPTFDALKEGVNLYDLTTENLNSVDFTWKETSENDIWYRTLMIDTVPIQNKYHKAKFWLPANEVPNSRTVTTATTRSWYSDTTSSLGLTSGNAVSGSVVLQSIEGLIGYAPVFGAANDDTGILVVTDNTGFVNESEFTFVMHGIPDSGTVGTKYLFRQSGGATYLDAYIDSSENLKVDMNGATMTATSTVQADGETPFSLIVTYKSGSSAAGLGPDLQMFVNGKREDYVVLGSGNVTHSANLLIGGTGGSTNYTGKLEEIIIYQKRYEIPQSQDKYQYSTAPIEDLTAANKSLVHNSKLFLFDYHNIRGKDSEQVCESNPISWRTTA